MDIRGTKLFQRLHEWLAGEPVYKFMREDRDSLMEDMRVIADAICGKPDMRPGELLLKISDLKAECENNDTLRAQLTAVTAERDGHLETIRETFRVLESRGQAPDDNAPLSVTVRRVLDYLDRVTAERDALSAQLAALKKRVADAERVDHYFPTRTPGPQRMTFALVRLEDGE